MSNSTSKEQIINQAIKFHLQGKLSEAKQYYQYCINQGFRDVRVFSNFGLILKNLGKLKEAEVSTRKAIELNPNFANAYCNLGGILKDLGRLKEAEIPTRKAIELDPNFANAYCNLGGILRSLEKLEEAEVSTRKAIELDPDLANAYCNLGGILKDLGKLKDAELLYRRAIELNPNLAIAYFSLSTFKVFNANKKWQDQLFSENILKNKSQKDQVNIYFARANIHHRESKFKESSKELQLANNLKQTLNPTNLESLLKQSKELMLESKKVFLNKKKDKIFPESIFIVGMPRSGSTLLESILSINSNVDALGETNIFKESFLNWKKPLQKSTLAELYLNKTNTKSNESRTTTNKWLYNYLYAGIISTQIPNCKIIHCFRNPLDNILSIYRANFAQGNEYSSFLVDCAKVYLDQEEVMSEYKKRFRPIIYDFNYDSLVVNPREEIKSLISWLGWKWNDQYLSPHLNQRSISTASSIQVRSPINSKSIGNWKNYEDMLKPAIEIITKVNRYRYLKYS